MRWIRVVALASFMPFTMAPLSVLESEKQRVERHHREEMEQRERFFRGALIAFVVVSLAGCVTVVLVRRRPS